jgi:hypothetical protein
MKKPNPQNSKSKDHPSLEVYTIQTERGLRASQIKREALKRICVNSHITARRSDVEVPVVALINIYLDNGRFYRQGELPKARETMPTRKELAKRLRTIETACCSIVRVFEASQLAEVVLYECALGESEKIGRSADESCQIIKSIVNNLKVMHVIARLSASDAESSERFEFLSPPPRANPRLNLYACQLMELWKRRLNGELKLWAHDDNQKCSDLVAFVVECFALAGAQKSRLAVCRMLQRLIQNGKFGAFEARVAAAGAARSEPRR